MNLFSLILGLFHRKETAPPVNRLSQEPRLPERADELSGMPLDYLIGSDSVRLGSAQRITEVGYDINIVPKFGVGVGYCNLFSEAGEIAKYKPYLHNSDTARDYNEGQIDPKGAGWMLNLSEQFSRRQKAGFKYVELDNPDAYHTDDVNGAVGTAAQYGLKVLAKNPGLCEPSPVSYIAHPNVSGIIVERGAGTPKEMDALRRKAGRPDLPVWFVFFGSAHKVAGEYGIMAKAYKNMGVTYSSKGEYGSSEDVLVPVAP